MHNNTDQNSEYVEIPDVSIGIDLKIFEHIKALVIGGSELWQTKLREILPHFTFQFGDESFDENILINSDIIFMNVACKFRHNYFYKAMDIIRKYSKKLVYVSKTNINLALEEFKQGLIN